MKSYPQLATILDLTNDANRRPVSEAIDKENE